MNPIFMKVVTQGALTLIEDLLRTVTPELENEAIFIIQDLIHKLEMHLESLVPAESPILSEPSTLN